MYLLALAIGSAAADDWIGRIGPDVHGVPIGRECHGWSLIVVVVG
jgi:hypothetical protein